MDLTSVTKKHLVTLKDFKNEPEIFQEKQTELLKFWVESVASEKFLKREIVDSAKLISSNLFIN